jgi:hypothetical protein
LNSPQLPLLSVTHSSNPMSRPDSEHRTLSATDEKAANFQGMLPSAERRSPMFSSICTLAASPTDAQMAQDQEPVPEFADSSGPLFAMYCSTKKDYKSPEFLKTGADTLIVFVSTSFFFFSHHFENQLNFTVGLVFRHRCHNTCSDIPGPLAKPTGYVCILP